MSGDRRDRATVKKNLMALYLWGCFKRCFIPLTAHTTVHNNKSWYRGIPADKDAGDLYNRRVYGLGKDMIQDSLDDNLVRDEDGEIDFEHYYEGATAEIELFAKREESAKKKKEKAKKPKPKSKSKKSKSKPKSKKEKSKATESNTTKSRSATKRSLPKENTNSKSGQPSSKRQKTGATEKQDVDHSASESNKKKSDIDQFIDKIKIKYNLDKEENDKDDNDAQHSDDDDAASVAKSMSGLAISTPQNKDESWKVFQVTTGKDAQRLKALQKEAKYYDELSGRKRWFINMCCGNKRKLMYYKTATMQKQLEFIGDDNAFISSAVFNHGKEWKNIIRHDYFGYYIAPQFEQLAHDIADAVPTATVTIINHAVDQTKKWAKQNGHVLYNLEPPIDEEQEQKTDFGTIGQQHNHNHNNNRNDNNRNMMVSTDLITQCKECRDNCNSRLCQWMMMQLITAMALGEIDCCQLKTDFISKLDLDAPKTMIEESDNNEDDILNIDGDDE